MNQRAPWTGRTRFAFVLACSDPVWGDASAIGIIEAPCLPKEGTVVGATLIAAPSSAQNKDGKRTPEMRQIKNGNQ